MVFRQAQPQEITAIFEEGYKEWRKNRTFEQYCIDNAKEDAYGTRYVIDVDSEIVSSAIVLSLHTISGKKVYGIGSVVTPKMHAGKGYATELLVNILKEKDDAYVFLFSDIDPGFYKRLGFRLLPSRFQRKSTCMVKCRDDNWAKLIACSLETIPDYF